MRSGIPGVAQAVPLNHFLESFASNCIEVPSILALASHENPITMNFLKFALALVLINPGIVFAQDNSAQASFYVSPTGDDANPGTMASPFKTISKARDVVRGMKGNMSGDVYVYLRSGIYFLTSPIEFNVSDGGTNGHQVIYKAYTGEVPVISGATLVSGWTLDKPNIYKAALNRDTKLRSLSVNGVRAQMTTSNDIRLDSPVAAHWGTFPVAGTEPWAQTSGSGFDGVQFPSAQVGTFTNASDMELEWAWAWCQNIACVREVTSENGSTIVKMQQPYGAIASKLRWCALGGIKDNKGYVYTLRNAYELLTKPGDFYFNRSTKTLYYYSRGEDMSTATVYAPLSEGLIKIYGTTTASRVHNLQFYGITFQHDHYLLTDVGGSRGFVGSQSSAIFYKFRDDGDHNVAYFTNEDLPQATIELRNCDGIRIERCHFLQLGSAIAVSLYNDVINSTVIGNVFKDLSGNAVNIGHPQHYSIPLPGSLFAPGVAGLCKNDLITDNVVRNVSCEFKRIEGICGYDLDSVEISHNDVQKLPYGGIAVGWWWGSNGRIPAPSNCKDVKINFNRVAYDHDRLSDGGGIYVMGPTPGGEIAGNYIFKCPAYGCIMPDEGSGFWTIKNNVIEKCNRWFFNWAGSTHDLIIDSNYVTKDSNRNNGKNCTLTNTHTEATAPPWSSDAQAIVNFAGIEPKYQDILKDVDDK